MCSEDEEITVSRNSSAGPHWMQFVPADIQLVWHGANDRTNLRAFLDSPIQWAELDVNLSDDGERLILRHDSYAELAAWSGEEELLLEDALAAMAEHGRSIKIDFKIGGPWIDEILFALDSVEIPNPKLWFNGDLDLLGRAWLTKLSDRYADAVVQIPLNSAIALDPPPVNVEPIVEELTACGVNRWSIGWRYPHSDGLIAELKRYGQEVNIYGVDNLAEFLAALDRQPTSVTADFNFPEWGLHGRGSGHRGHFHAS